MIDTKKKLAGVLLPVFALRRADDLGIGDTKCVLDAIDFCARNSMAVLQVLPINETGGDNSPYNALSSVALDPVLLTMTPDMVPGLSKEIVDAHISKELSSTARKGSVDYGLIKPLKLKLLRAAFDQFRKEHLKQASGKESSKGQEFRQFQKDHTNWLTNYSLFRTLVTVHAENASWTQWPKEHSSPADAEVWLTKQKNKDELLELREFYAFVQWVAFDQWAQVRKHADSRAVGLMGDIPFGVSRYSADVWSEQQLFDLDWSGGAPPETWFQDDLFTAKWGQNWGLPLYKWDAHKQEKFRWWRQRVQECTKIFHYFRIDHVLGFFRIYSFPWVPERNAEFLNLTEEEAEEVTGGRLPGFKPRSDEKPDWAKANSKEGQALLEVVMDAAGNAGVVAEDLGGMVPPYVHPTLQKLGIPGFTIPYWERDPKTEELKESKSLPELSLATYATHDHEPIKLYYDNMVKRWHGPDGHPHWLEIQRLMRWLGLDDENPPLTFTPELHDAFTKCLLETPCWLAVFMITDLLGTTERFNQPGTSGESNWSRRLDNPLSDFENTPPYSERLTRFRQLVKETGRLPQTAQVGTIR
jgi:4-alpha-glucanotransferase